VRPKDGSRSAKRQERKGRHLAYIRVRKITSVREHDHAAKLTMLRGRRQNTARRSVSLNNFFVGGVRERVGGDGGPEERSGRGKELEGVALMGRERSYGDQDRHKNSNRQNGPFLERRGGRGAGEGPAQPQRATLPFRGPIARNARDSDWGDNEKVQTFADLKKERADWRILTGNQSEITSLPGRRIGDGGKKSIGGENTCIAYLKVSRRKSVPANHNQRHTG